MFFRHIPPRIVHVLIVFTTDLRQIAVIQFEGTDVIDTWYIYIEQVRPFWKKCQMPCVSWTPFEIALFTIFVGMLLLCSHTIKLPFILSGLFLPMNLKYRFWNLTITQSGASGNAHYKWLSFSRNKDYNTVFPSGARDVRFVIDHIVIHLHSLYT